jgi:hypothetical protein
MINLHGLAVDEFLDGLESAINAGVRNATCIPWVNRDSGDSMAVVRVALLGRGWVYNGPLDQFERAGWYLFLRSQGELSSPIAQWQPLGRDTTGLMFDDMQLGPEIEDTPASPQFSLF